MIDNTGRAGSLHLLARSGAMNILRDARLGLLLITPAAAHATANDLRSIAGMQSHNSALVAFAPSLVDRRMKQQQAVIARLAVQAASRDLLFVQVDTARVIGAHDTATALRRRFRVPADEFRVVLIDKNSKVILSGAAPIAGGAIVRAIDAAH